MTFHGATVSCDENVGYEWGFSVAMYFCATSVGRSL